MTDYVTDKEKLTTAFRVLRKQGFVAKQDFRCCNTCAWAEIDDEDVNVVFYHHQDHESFDAFGNLSRRMYLSWRGDSQMIVDALIRAGLKVTWDGMSDLRIGIEPQ